jgi:hypothetical protein
MPGEFYIEGKNQTGDITTVVNNITNVQNDVTNIKNDVTEVKSDVTNIKNDVTSILSSIGKQPSSIDLWSPYLPSMSLETVPDTMVLPSITIAGLPAGVTIARAIMMLKFRKLGDSSGSDNMVNGAQNIQASGDGGTTWVTGIALGGDEFFCVGSAVETGDVMMGTDDIKSQVPANGEVMQFQWTDALVMELSLDFYDIQVGLRIWYTD